MIPALLIAIFPIGAFVLRRHWRHAHGFHRLALALITLAGLLFALPALQLIATAIVQTAGDIGEAAAVLDWRVLAGAAAGAALLASISIRRRRFMTLAGITGNDPGTR